MTVAEFKSLKKANGVYWRGDATDSGEKTKTSWDAVTIAWENGQVDIVHHGDMREIQRSFRSLASFAVLSPCCFPAPTLSLGARDCLGGAALKFLTIQYPADIFTSLR